MVNIKESDFIRVNNDVYGNPRFVISWLNLTNNNYNQNYEDILKLNKKLKLGGRKFHNKQFGGGIVFQSYNLRHIINFINKKLNEYYNNINNK